MMYLKVHHILDMLLLGMPLLLLLLHLHLALHLFQCLLEFQLDACSLCISSRLEIHPFRQQSLRENTKCVLSRDTLDTCALGSGGAEVQCTSPLINTCLWHVHVYSDYLPLLFIILNVKGFSRHRFEECLFWFYDFWCYCTFCRLPQNARSRRFDRRI
jgi:hypothetical protein